MRKTNRVFLNFFFPLISKFLFILIKRKKKPIPTPPMCSLLQLLQAFKGRKLRCLMSQLRGSSEPSPPGCVPGVPGTAVQIWKRQVQNQVMCSCQEHLKSPRKAAAQPHSQQMKCWWRTWMCLERHIVSPGHCSQNWGLCHCLGMGTRQQRAHHPGH